MSNLKIYRDKDIDTSVIKDKKIAIIGYGSQGFGQSQNLKDSGCDVVVGLRKNGKSWDKAKNSGLKVMEIEYPGKCRRNNLLSRRSMKLGHSNILNHHSTGELYES